MTAPADPRDGAGLRARAILAGQLAARALRRHTAEPFVAVLDPGVLAQRLDAIDRGLAAAEQLHLEAVQARAAA